MKLEHFKSNELTKLEASQVEGGRSRNVIIADLGGETSVKIVTIDRNDGTIIQKFKYYN